MNNSTRLFLEKLGFHILRIVNDTIFNRIVLSIIIACSLVVFIITLRQTGGGYWLLVLLFIALANLILSYSKSVRFAEFSNFLSSVIFIGLSFCLLLIVSFWIFLFH